MIKILANILALAALLYYIIEKNWLQILIGAFFAAIVFLTK